LKRRRATVLGLLAYVAFRAAMGVVLLVPLPICCFLGRAFGLACYRLLGRRRKRCLGNLARVFPAWSPARRRCLARGNFAHFGQAIVEVIQARALLQPRSFRRYVHMHNLEVIGEAAALGRGVICLTAHVGNWEVLGVASALSGYPLASLYKSLRRPMLDRLAREFRQRHGQRLVRAAGGVRGLLREIRGGGCVGILADQRSRQYDLYVPFLGLPTSVWGLVGTLALRTNAPVIVAFAVRRGWRFEYDVFIERIDVRRTGNLRRDILCVAQQYMGLVEKYVRLYPEQYVWVHKQWRAQDLDRADELLREVSELDRGRCAETAPLPSS